VDDDNSPIQLPRNTRKKKQVEHKKKNFGKNTHGLVAAQEAQIIGETTNQKPKKKVFSKSGRMKRGEGQNAVKNKRPHASVQRKNRKQRGCYTRHEPLQKKDIGR